MNAEAPMLELLTHTAAKGAAVLTVALLVGLALQKLAASRRYAIWISAVAALAVLPLAMALLPAWHVLPKTTTEFEWPVVEPELPEEVPVGAPTFVGEVIPVSVVASNPAPGVPPKSWSFDFTWERLFECLPVGWLAIAALMLLRLAWSAWCLRRLERVLKSGSCDALEKIAHEMGVARAPKLLVGGANAVPMVWGVWRPRLLLPAGFEQWSAAKLRGVLLHELAHLKRRDPLALWTAQWVKALHWFNPLAWLTIRQLRADQERACDDAVLRQGVRPSDYAQSLLDLSRHSRIAPGLALCALTITRCAPVESRVKAILDPNRHREPITRRWLACLAGFALLITLPVAMLHAIEGPKLRGRIMDRNGVVLAESTPEKVRHYPLKTLAAHTLGYTGRSDRDDPNPHGRAGVEKQEDATLTAGKDVGLSLDLRIQSLTHRAMTEAGVTRGAAVVLDPRTGEILAMVSLPSYDLNTMVPSISMANWESYSADRDLPLFDRCAVGLFVPGSAFMPLTALAGISAGVGDRFFECKGEMKIGNKNYQCWIHRQSGKSHGKLGMTEAIANTCSCFWYQFGIATGPGAIGKVGGMIGMGQGYGIMERESEGILPGSKWLAEKRSGEQWSDGYTANLAIGQGMTLVTPLQLAVLAATIGNGGKIPQPKVLLETKADWRADLAAEGLVASQIGALREGMRLVVNGDSGTGKAAKSDQVVIAGKTGTAQNWRRIDGKAVDDNHAWFIGFAPFDQPTLAFAILKQGGKSGGGDCGPIAKRIVEAALALPADGSGEVKPVGDAVGAEWERLEKARANVDGTADSLKQEIVQAGPDAKTGFTLNEVTVQNGHLIVRGIASGMVQALEFRNRLIEVGKKREIEWLFPVPKTLKDGKRVGFEVLGTIVKSGNEGTGIEQVKEGLRILGDPRANGWPELQKISGVAELPESKWSTVLRGESGENSVHFYLSREAAADWMRRSFGEKTDVGWLSTDEIMVKRYEAKNGWEVEASTMRPQRLIKVTLLNAATPPAPSSAAEKAKFDANAGPLKREIEQAALAAKTGSSLDEVTVKDGRVVAHGVATAMLQALAFREKLDEIGKNWQIEWNFPVPRALADGRVEFRASGVHQPAQSNTEDESKPIQVTPTPGSKVEIRQQSDDAIRMRPADANAWKFLKGKGFLADLPAEAVVPVLSERDKQHSSGFFQFRFSAPRAAVRQWLLESLRVKEGHEETFLNWPDPPKTFHLTYSALNDCQITVHGQDGGRVHVSISKRKPLILIAPDEATPPTPKTAAPKELKGVVTVDSQWPAPPVVLMNDPSPLGLYVEDTYREEQDELKAALAQRDSINNRFNKALLTRQAAR